MKGTPPPTGHLLLLPWFDDEVDALPTMLDRAPSIRVLERSGMRFVPDCAIGGTPTRFIEWRKDAGG